MYETNWILLRKTSSQELNLQSSNFLQQFQAWETSYPMENPNLGNTELRITRIQYTDLGKKIGHLK